MLAFSLVVTTVSVTILGYLTVQAVLQQPINPVASAAQDVLNVNLPPLEQDGPAPVETLPPNEVAPTALPTHVPWQDSNRLNILLMGIDRRPGEPFISRTDSIMLISFNPETEEISVLSIPRDLYVVIPGRGRDRINTAFVYGASGSDPAAGAALAMQTVSYNLGVNVDHYVLVDFSAVIQSVDAIGGIDVNVPFEIYDPTYPDMNYGFDPLHIPAGLQHLNGEMALKYARTRHVDNDFGRAARQQQVLMAVRSKALSLGVTDMLTQAPFLWQQLREGVRTDLSYEQMLQLAKSVSTIPDENFRTAVLNYDYVVSYRTDAGASVLVLINDRAAALIQEMFYDE